ncbi:hypothetical protein [Leifsonia sp. NPDC058248]|uniref:hypothetical protein n=1 Tax=Leifsonia sp. NPDC058248 TaxID=3346402 RepID=UPI0036DDC623
MSTTLRTKRRYAHELYPHPDEFEVRPLAVEVPYLYAQAIGYEVAGTGWFDAQTPEGYRTAGDRTMALIRQRQLALIADALLQGMAGDEAWKWAAEREDYEGGWISERAEVYGLDWAAIKPYPCGPEPDHHDHYGEPDSRGWRQVFRTAGKESECPDCTTTDAPDLSPAELAKVTAFGLDEPEPTVADS